MHINPHISYVQNGTNGYTGALNGATLRLASDTSATTFWDVGVGTSGVGADKFSIGRTSTSRFVITNTGNIGIGTNNPSSNLDIFGADSEVLVHYSNNSRGGFRALSTQRVAVLTTDQIDDLVFGWENGPKGAFTERMRLDNGSGNLLIGTTIDTGYKLEVNGNVKVSGTIEDVGGTSADWNQAYLWGDHSTQGYLTSTTGWTGVIMIPPTPEGWTQIQVQDGLIINVM
jgi:hypothetical protein